MHKFIIKKKRKEKERRKKKETAVNENIAAHTHSSSLGERMRENEETTNEGGQSCCLMNYWKLFRYCGDEGNVHRTVECSPADTILEFKRRNTVKQLSGILLKGILSFPA